MKCFVAVLCFLALGLTQALETPVTPLHYFLTHPNEGRIINGQEAIPGQIPWQAAVHMTDSQGRGFFCGGSLISTTWVLTAAHCVKGFVSWKIRLGATRNDINEVTQQIFNTRNAIYHEQYDEAYLHNDVALIRLPQPALLNSYVQIVRLPKRSEVSDSLAGKTVQISGWGKISDAAPGATNKLRFTTTEVITNDICKIYFGSTIISSSICTKGSRGQSTCSGDSGGPLIYMRNGIPVHSGVVSFVSGAGCETNNPQGYARTSSFLAWISGKTGIPIEN